MLQDPLNYKPIVEQKRWILNEHSSLQGVYLKMSTQTCKQLKLKRNAIL